MKRLIVPIVFLIGLLIYLNFRNDSLDTFLSSFDGRIYEQDIVGLSIQYKISATKVRQKLIKQGFKSHYYTDEFCSFRYYIKNEEDILEPAPLIDWNKRLDSSVFLEYKLKGVRLMEFLYHNIQSSRRTEHD